MDALNKIYVEPTNRCNLACVTCICEYGHLPEQPWREIWSGPQYAAFRGRVRNFEFSPCSDCGGCESAENNEEDCFGNPFPVCGDCLWARGVLRCA